jgi:hypothetical protein
LECASQAHTRTVQPRLHSGGLQRKNLRGLLNAQSFHLPKHEHFSEWFRKSIDRPFQQTPYLVQCRLALGVGLGTAAGKWDNLTHGHVIEFAKGQILATTPLPASRFIDDDTRQPGTELSLLAEALQGTETSDIGILHDFFGFPVGTEDTARSAEKSPVVPAHYFLKSPSACIAGKGNELWFGRPFQAWSRRFSA